MYQPFVDSIESTNSTTEIIWSTLAIFTDLDLAFKQIWGAYLLSLAIITLWEGLIV